MQKKFRFRPVLIALGAIVAGNCAAQTAQEAEKSRDDGFRFSVSQRAWFASYKMSLLDAQVVTSAGGAPLIKGAYVSRTETHVLPYTSLAVGYHDFSLALSGTPKTKFSNQDALGGRVSRDEFDLSAGYAVSPNLSLALIYKWGTITPIATAAGSALLSPPTEVKISGWLVGAAGSVPILALSADGKLNLYGNIAIGTAGSKTSFGKSKGDYQIAEAGLAYVLLSNPSGALSSLSVQVGYRAQSVTLRDIEVVTASAVTGAILASEKVKLKTPTRGPIVSIVASF